ncbi:MAG: oligosaccharide flippase family protein [Prevotella sp.]|nr:oligosaccharide flippase family protein [Prevotella sp.]
MEKEQSQNNYSHILKYTGIFGGVQGLNILIALVRNKFVALILGPYGMGLLSLFNSTIHFLSDSTNLGLGMSAVKNISVAYAQHDEESLRRSIKVVRSWSLLTAVFGMLLCVVLAPLLSQWTFGWGNHALHFALLSPVVGMTAITGGELAIMKGTRELGNLARQALFSIVAALFISIPIYYIWGEEAIVPSIVLMGLSQMIITISYSFRSYPPHFSLRGSTLRQGMGMVKLGTAFLFAGMFGSGSEFVVKSFLNNAGSQVILGLYNAGYMMAFTYAGMVFSAMETDYFPRLSSVPTVGAQLNDVVNKQIEVSLLLLSPLLACFIIGLPIIIPLLYSSDFLPVMGMSQLTVLAMYLRAVKLPVAYLPLARGDSHIYLLMETLYDFVFAALSIVCFLKFGLVGMGIAILGAAVFDFFLLIFYMRYRYHYVLSRGVQVIFLKQAPIGVAVYAVTFLHNAWAYWIAGLLLCALSVYISITILHSKTHLWEHLTKRFRRQA